ncbi:hypothetical protein AB1L07_25210 [Niallia alba]|uniref:hypothetical protein n=1 Tax=Niallia alba TaxID=2729105 RepID=UPI0039A29489
MTNSKTRKQFNKLIEHCITNKGNTFCLYSNEDEMNLIGLTKEPLEPNEAIVFLQKNNKTYVKGTFDGIQYSSSSIELLNPLSTTIIGVDNRDKEDVIIYFQSNEEYSRISSSSSFEGEDTLYIYWEYNHYSCLTISTFDPVQKKTIRETVFGDMEPFKRFLKAIVRKALPKIDKFEEQDTNTYDLNDYIEQCDYKPNPYEDLFKDLDEEYEN